MRNVWFIANRPQKIHNTFALQKTFETPGTKLLITELPEQNIVAYLKWQGVDMVRRRQPHLPENGGGNLVLIKQEELQHRNIKADIQMRIDGYLIVRLP